MNHCTVCGAAVREGARFCTTCGARLEDTATPDPGTATGDQTATLHSIPDDAAVAPDATGGREARDHHEETPGSEGTASFVSAGDEQAPAEPGSATEDHYVSSWPSLETNDDAADSTDETSGGDTMSDAGESTAWVPSTEPDDEPSTVVADATAGDDADHHGASAWESWAPEAQPGSTIGEGDDDALGELRQIVDELKLRVDRLVRPSSPASRGIDARDLADEMDVWAKDAIDTDELLSAIQRVREAPRDLDAITHLAYHADDLELLIERYRSIMSSSETWASRLRTSRSDGTSS